MSRTGTSASEKNDALAEAEAKLQAKYKETCDQYVRSGVTTNRSVQFLIDQLDKMGCTPPEGFIRCTDCGYMKALGAFHLLSETKVEPVTSAAPAVEQQTKDNPKNTINKSIGSACKTYFSRTLKRIGQATKVEEEAQDQLLEKLNTPAAEEAKTTTIKTPEIYLCQQHLSSEGQAHRTIVHELIHAVDTCRTKMDPQKNCIHLACTEIRAENLSGECNFWNELMKVGPHSLKKHGQDCVKRRAMLSVQSHPRCRDRAEEYVDAAMRRCYSDIFPFERHPNEQPP